MAGRVDNTLLIQDLSSQSQGPDFEIVLFTVFTRSKRRVGTVNESKRIATVLQQNYCENVCYFYATGTKASCLVPENRNLLCNCYEKAHFLPLRDSFLRERTLGYFNKNYKGTNS